MTRKSARTLGGVLCALGAIATVSSSLQGRGNLAYASHIRRNSEPTQARTGKFSPDGRYFTAIGTRVNGVDLLESLCEKKPRRGMSRLDTIFRWDLETGALVRTDFPVLFHPVALSADGRTVVSGTQIFRIDESGAPFLRGELPIEPTFGVGFAADGQTVLIYDNIHREIHWLKLDGEIRKVLRIGSRDPKCLTFGDNGDFAFVERGPKDSFSLHAFDPTTGGFSVRALPDDWRSVPHLSYFGKSVIVGHKATLPYDGPPQVFIWNLSATAGRDDWRGVRRHPGFVDENTSVSPFDGTKIRLGRPVLRPAPGTPPERLATKIDPATNRPIPLEGIAGWDD